MSDPTKACSLTKDEIEKLILAHSSQTMYNNMEIAIERINYLNKRFKAFDEVEIVKEETKPQETAKW